MFKKVLIANRGEIASRIIRTCKRLNIDTVAIYSDPDKDSLYVQEATECYPLGGTRVHESYLNIDKVLQIAKEAEVDAIHPGYGLLSENGDFAERCAERGFVFIGPKPSIMRKMGNKIEARRTMEEAGVPIVPGTDAATNDLEEAIQEAKRIGYPIMLKAASGGGGIGMQLVQNEAELMKAFDGNSKRATMFFGDGTMFLEKFIEEPRHIEIQLLADEHGNAVYLFERECSIQRRHQKVVEEAPSPFLSEETRTKMGEVAVRAALQLGYSNAGTIEFLVDAHEHFYFLEMNTRLQVEHPVTEEITGVDLVEEQIRVASGEPLRFRQKDLTIEGHAIEVRIYAEDPYTFYPAPGQLTDLQLPQGDGIRHELSIHRTSTISPFYDPMIAKYVVSGDSRDAVIRRIEETLPTYKVEGIKTNIPMIYDVISHPQFKAGRTTTNFVELYYQNQPN
ncbi:biotin carboxylase [Pontibacillus halophilus JSM 076056 = DSM 19796]|uniref:biotin carboxylase n=1 Tax=Pontibacillus halophilus JSM 076056 = DSM 19796 TaxID=1385510 RepID=A0A0A5GLF4_9BACI|nr:acetyl-CoA carboxylase biotin carboxylase subunit [Pontibacillus halophilus]KGX92028.1 biotin carboxylase [Pontibacillus halophilus JSM 076056 = DSM 19796]